MCRSMVGSAQEVTGSVAVLVKVATECQRAIAKAQGTGGTGAQKSKAYFADGTWSEGGSRYLAYVFCIAASSEYLGGLCEHFGHPVLIS